MKRKYVLAAVLVLAVILVIGIVGKLETHYKRTGFVTEATAGMILVEDTTGNLWELESAEFAVGDNVVLSMDTAGTSDITDDIIRGIKAR